MCIRDRSVSETSGMSSVTIIGGGLVAEVGGRTSPIPSGTVIDGGTNGADAPANGGGGGGGGANAMPGGDAPGGGCGGASGAGAFVIGCGELPLGAPGKSPFVRKISKRITCASRSLSSSANTIVWSSRLCAIALTAASCAESRCCATLHHHVRSLPS